MPSDMQRCMQYCQWCQHLRCKYSVPEVHLHPSRVASSPALWGTVIQKYEPEPLVLSAFAPAGSRLQVSTEAISVKHHGPMNLATVQLVYFMLKMWLVDFRVLDEIIYIIGLHIYEQKPENSYIIKHTDNLNSCFTSEFYYSNIFLSKEVGVQNWLCPRFWVLLKGEKD